MIGKSVKNRQNQAFLNDIRGRDSICRLRRLPFKVGSSISACQRVALGNLIHVPFGGWEVISSLVRPLRGFPCPLSQ